MADAKIFLSDCLACDSCVTADEGVRVSQQNAKDFFRILNLNKVGYLRCSLVLWPRRWGGRGEAPSEPLSRGPRPCVYPSEQNPCAESHFLTTWSKAASITSQAPRLGAGPPHKVRGAHSSLKAQGGALHLGQPQGHAFVLPGSLGPARVQPLSCPC